MSDEFEASVPDSPATRLLTRDALGRPMYDLRLSVMDRCNFRCPYCMPSDQYPEHYNFLRRDQQLSFSEILRLTRLFVGLGVGKIRLTGGEPLLRPKLAELVRDIRAIDGVQDIAMATNGVLLDRHAQSLFDAGLDRITISLDSTDAEVFKIMSGGRADLDTVLKNVGHAREVGFTAIKVNTVVQRGINDHTVLDLLEYFRGTGVIVRFIEFMDVGNINDWKNSKVVPSAELIKLISTRWQIRALMPNYIGEVATRYAYEDGQGEIGFISSVSQPFCTSCTRARLSSDGQLFTCLFATKGTSLKTLLRGGADESQLVECIEQVWTRRADRYSEVRPRPGDIRSKESKIEMYYIGG